MMPIGLGKEFSGPGQEAVAAVLEQRFGPLTPVSERLGNGPAVYYALPGFRGRIGFISAVSHRFCESCNRVRLTAEGYLIRCLQYDDGTDLRALLRKGASDAVLLEAIAGEITAKPRDIIFRYCRAPGRGGGPRRGVWIRSEDESWEK